MDYAEIAVGLRPSVQNTLYSGLINQILLYVAEERTDEKEIFNTFSDFYDDYYDDINLMMAIVDPKITDKGYMLYNELAADFEEFMEMPLENLREYWGKR